MHAEEFRDDVSFLTTSDVLMSIQHSSENNDLEIDGLDSSQTNYDSASHRRRQTT